VFADPEAFNSSFEVMVKHVESSRRRFSVGVIVADFQLIYGRVVGSS